MDEKTQTKWDAIYQTKTDSGLAAKVLVDNLHLLPQGKQLHALDIACGLGANSLLLACHGFSVDCWDISTVAIDKLKQNPAFSNQLRPLACDVTQHGIAANSYELIIVSRFLDRSLIPHIITGLKTGGLVFYQTFISDKVSNSGPKSTRFLLQKNELLQLFSPLTTLVYREEGQVGDHSKGFRNEAMLIAQKGL